MPILQHLLVYSIWPTAFPQRIKGPTSFIHNITESGWGWGGGGGRCHDHMLDMGEKNTQIEHMESSVITRISEKDTDSDRRIIKWHHCHLSAKMIMNLQITRSTCIHQ